ncbi:hypothetical protein LGQ02_09730 [Bacillus shivajii]|uniref:DUF6884 domain-containing protein n=1 Tax=Bacillus shivajii TaxID=1983719 RepID=UPI001CFB700E|nr:DUF6884 domain-containing protein [Bacillus shivajii]UCZ54974.1 hypothetical protein LGQ02_09730 [Bacillus shivajii]
MSRLCIIPCGAKKVWDKEPDAAPTKAKDVYIGTFSRACQRYAIEFIGDWVILSAKHGFLHPTDTVEHNYDVSFTSKSSEIISIDQLKEQMGDKGLNDYDEVIVLGGKKYRRVVEKLFPNEKLTYPLNGCKGIGFMLQKLNRSIKNGEEIK